MSLQIWIPFVDGTLKQQGLKELTLSSSNTSVQNNGKLGKCLSFNGSSSVITSSQNVGITGDASYTIAFWMYWAGDTWSNDFVGIVGWGSMSTNKSAYAIIYNGRPDLDFWNNRYLATNQLQVKKWYHIAMVKTPGNISTTTKIYVDGQEVAATANSTITPSIVDSQLLIGRLNNSTNRWFNGYLNDVRIYDHALSPMEVKELSKGLILHYPLNRNGFGQENIFLNSSLTDLTSENLSTKIRYANPYVPVITEDGLKFTWSGSSAREVDLYLGSNLDTNTYYTLSFIYRSNMNIGSSFYLRNGNTLVGYWSQTTIPYSENWSTYKCTFKPTSYQGADVTTGDSLTLFYSGYTENKWIELKKSSIKLEKGTVATPWCLNLSDDLATNIGLDSTIEYDCSGFGNNGTKNNITYVSDTPKYSVSSVFNGTNSYVKINDNTWMMKGMPAMTINLWAKATTWPTNGGRLLSCTETGGFNLEAGNSGYWRFPVYVYTNEAQTSSAYKYDSKEIKISDLTPNDWNMITLVYETTGTKTYLNGQLHHTYTNTSYGINFNTSARLFLGCEANVANPYTPYFNGMESDFRIYATALSADDIQSLYADKGYIDNKGNVYGTLYEIG